MNILLIKFFSANISEKELRVLKIFFNHVREFGMYMRQYNTHVNSFSIISFLIINICLELVRDFQQQQKK